MGYTVCGKRCQSHEEYSDPEESVVALLVF